MRALVPAVLALVLAGCCPTPPGGAGPLGGDPVESPDGCVTRCDDGFVCLIEPGGTERCVLSSSAKVELRVESPGASETVRGATLRVACRATAPQLRSVSVRVEPAAGGAALESRAFRSDDEKPYVAEFDASTALFDGAWEAVCLIEYGPARFVLDAQSEPVRFEVNRRGPAIRHTPPSGWHARAGVLQLRAEVDGLGESPATDAVRVHVPGAVLATTSPAPGVHAFELDLVALTPEDVHGPLEYELRARDAFGNEAREKYSIDVDATPPVVAIEGDATSHARARRFDVRATIATDGAPLVADTVKLVGPGGVAQVAGVLVEGDSWRFEIDPVDFTAPDFEGAVAFTVTAEDEVGQEARASGEFRIDGLAPTLAPVFEDAQRWLGPSDRAVILVDVTGTTLAPRVAHAGEERACEGTGPYSCTVEIADLANGLEDADFGVTVTVSDEAGNTAEARVALRVDTKPPSLAVDPDEAWYARAATLEVFARVVDAGAGVGEGDRAPALVYASSRAAGTRTEGGWAFTLAAADLATEGRTHPAAPLELVATDAAGNAATLPFTRRVDDEPPLISPQAVPYDAGATHLVRNDTATTLTARVTDPGRDALDADVAGAGVELASVAISYAKRDGTTASIEATNTGDDFTWEFDASTPKLDAAAAEVTLTVTAKDAVGNESKATFGVAITRRLWEFDTTTGAPVLGAVTLAGGKVFVAISHATGDNVFAIDATTGTKAWSAALAGTPTTPVTIGSTLAYVASEAAGGSLHAFTPAQASATAAPAWECAGHGVARGALANATLEWAGPPTEAVFYPSAAPALHAIRRNATDSGCDVETIALAPHDPGAGAVTHAPGAVWVTLNEGRVARVPLATTGALFGTPAITEAITGAFALLEAPLDSTGHAFVQTPGALVTLTSTLAGSWRGASPRLTTRAAPPALLADGTAIFGSDDGALFRFDTAGAAPAFLLDVNDAASAPTPVRTTPALGESTDGTTVTRTLYFGANDGTIRAVTADGAALWTHAGTAPIEASPALGCNGVLYAGTTDGKVRALVTDSAGPAAAPWPTLRHDNRRTGSTTTATIVGGACVD